MDIYKAYIGYDTSNLDGLINQLNNTIVNDAAGAAITGSENVKNEMSMFWAGAAAEQFKMKLTNDTQLLYQSLVIVIQGLEQEITQMRVNMANSDSAIADDILGSISSGGGGNSSSSPTRINAEDARQIAEAEKKAAEDAQSLEGGETSEEQTEPSQEEIDQAAAEQAAAEQAAAEQAAAEQAAAEQAAAEQAAAEQAAAEQAAAEQAAAEQAAAEQAAAEQAAQQAAQQNPTTPLVSTPTPDQNLLGSREGSYDFYDAREALGGIKQGETFYNPWRASSKNTTGLGTAFNYFKQAAGDHYTLGIDQYGVYRVTDTNTGQVYVAVAYGQGESRGQVIDTSWGPGIVVDSCGTPGIVDIAADFSNSF